MRKCRNYLTWHVLQVLKSEGDAATPSFSENNPPPLLLGSLPPKFLRSTHLTFTNSTSQFRDIFTKCRIQQCWRHKRCNYWALCCKSWPECSPRMWRRCGPGWRTTALHCLLECNTFDIDVNSFHNTRVLGHIKIFAKQTASQWLTVWTSKCPDFMFITFKCKESKTLLKCGKVVVGALNMEKAPVTSRGWGPSPNIMKMMYYAHWCHNCGALVAGPLALGGVGSMRQCGAAHQLSGASWRGHIALVSRAHVTRDGGGARDAGHVTQHVLCAVRHLLDRIPCDHHQCAAVPRLAAENARWKLSVSWTRHGQPAAVSSSSRYSVISQPSE